MASRWCSRCKLPPGQTALDDQLKAAIVRLDEESGESLWGAPNNFYVITRYNRSPLYAMAVYQLSEEIRRGMGR